MSAGRSTNLAEWPFLQGVLNSMDCELPTISTSRWPACPQAYLGDPASLPGTRMLQQSRKVLASATIAKAPPAGVENLTITRGNHHFLSMLSTDTPVESPATERMLADNFGASHLTR